MSPTTDPDPMALPPWVEDVLDVIAAIPAGRVLSYGDVGARAGVAARQVGQAVSRYGADLPWWRVVRVDGRHPEALRARSAPHHRAEGTPRTGDRVDMTRARWDGRPER